MRTLLIIALIMSVIWNCAEADEKYCYASVGMGKNYSSQGSATEWIDQNELGSMFGLGCRYKIWNNLHGETSYNHYSQLLVNDPFNSLDESRAFMIYTKVEWRFW